MRGSDKIAEISELINQGLTSTDISKKIGISNTQVRRIAKAYLPTQYATLLKNGKQKKKPSWGYRPGFVQR